MVLPRHVWSIRALRSNGVGVVVGALVLALCASLLPAQTGAPPATGDMQKDPASQPAGPDTEPAPPEKITKAFVIPLRGVITDETLREFAKKVARVRREKAELVILDMDTVGGAAGPALDIVRSIRDDLGGIRTVCYVRDRALAAGAMIALSCGEIVLTPDAKIGDCRPDYTGAGGRIKGVERKKIENVIRTELRRSALRNGYPAVLAERMVGKEPEVWLIRNVTDGKLQYVAAEDVKGRLRFPPGATTLPSNPNADWEFVRVAVPEGIILVATASQATEYGLASAIIPAPAADPLRGILKHFNVAARPVVLEDTRPAPTGAGADSAVPAGSKKTDRGWFAAVKKPTLPQEPKNVFIIPIREEIGEKTFQALQRKVARCKGKGADLVIFDMDTWGGGVIAALDITRMLKTELEGIRTVCFVRTRAISAGAMIAVACNEIVMTPVGTLGDCAPIALGEKLEGVEREKIETVLRTEFEESANRNGYNPALAVSMVSFDEEVWLIRNKGDRELRYVLRKDWKGRVDIPEGVSEVPSSPTARWELLEVVVHEGKLLTMHSQQAVNLGFAAGIVRTSEGSPYSEILKRYNVRTEPTVLSDSWSEKLVEFLRTPAVWGFLLFVALLCGYVEMHTPGFGVAGAVAIICFAILFGSGYLVGLAQWWEIALFVLGLVLIAVEVFVTPGFGVLGIAGILCCFVGLVTTLVNNPPGRMPIPETDLDWRIFSNGVFAMGVGFVASVIAGAFLSKYFPRIPLANRIILPPLGPDSTVSVEHGSQLARVQVGDVGVVEGMLRPVGKVRFGGELLDAVSEGEMIEAGSRVRILRREGNRLVVERTAR